MSAQKENRTKLLLVVGIVAAVGLSIFLHLKLEQRKNLADEAALEHPTARANRAMLEVDRAIINRKYERARTMLAKARVAIDEALEQRPDNPKLIRSRLVIIRRQAQIARELKTMGEAARLGREAVDVAAQIFKNDQTDERARHDRLATVREYAELAGQTVDVVELMRGAAIAVEDSTRFLPANGPVEALLAGTWIDIAKREHTLQRAAHAMSAAKRAVTIAQAAREGQGDPVSTASLAYDVVAIAAHIAEEMNQLKELERFEKDAISLLEFRAGLSPNDLLIPQALAARYGRLADQRMAQKDADGAKALHEKSITLLEPLYAAHAQNEDVRLSYVRTLNAYAAYHSAAKKHKRALKLYKSAFDAAVGLEKTGLRTRLITMGNYAQLLGRLDRIRPARKAASEAYVFAQKLSRDAPKERRAREDQCSAGLRYARLLRAAPGANRRQARGVAQAELDRLMLDTPPSKRQAALRTGLTALIRELK